VGGGGEMMDECQKAGTGGTSCEQCRKMHWYVQMPYESRLTPFFSTFLARLDCTGKKQKMNTSKQSSCFVTNHSYFQSKFRGGGSFLVGC
jgi:hypothetical protein